MIKKIAAFVIICFSLFVFVVFGALSFVNYDSVADKFTGHLGVEKENIGKISMNKFPMPYLVIESIKEEGKFELEQIKVHFSLLSLIKFSPQVNELEILDAKIYSDSKSLNIYDHEDLLKDFFKLQRINLNITNLSIINKKNYSILNFANCSLKKENPLSLDYVFKASGDVGSISGSIEEDKESVNFSLDINNKDYDFKLSQIYKEMKLESGVGEYKIKNLASVIYSILPDLSHIFNKLNQNESVDIKFSILNGDDEIQLKDINITSPFISGSGFINLAKNDKITSNVKLNFPKIDLTSLFNSNSSLTFDTVPSNLRFVFADKLLKTDITIDEVVLNNNESLEKIVFNSNLLNGTLKIDEFSGNIKPGGEFKFAGAVTQNSIRSMFDGNIYLKHNNINSLLNIFGLNNVAVKDPIPFILSSDLKLTLIDLFFKNLSLKTDDLNLSGNFSSKFIAQAPRLNIMLNISSLDLTGKTYPVISPFLDFIKNLTEDMKSLDYPSKFIPIRTVKYLTNLDIVIDGVKYNEYIFDKINLLAKIMPANVKISNLDLKTKDNYLSTSWDLDASSVLPSLKVEIKDGSLTTDLLTPAGFLNIRNKLVHNYSLDKATLQLYGQLTSLSQNDLMLKNVKFYLQNNNNLLQFSNIEAELLEGKFQGSGNVLLDPYSINFVYALNTIDLSKLSALFPKGFPTLNGEASINGNFFTSGNDLQNQLYNLTTKSQFIINTININNFAIDSFIEKINGADYNVQNLDKDINNAITTGSDKINNISGDINLQKGILILKNVNFATQYSGSAASLAINIYNFELDSSSILSFYIPAKLIRSSNPLAAPVDDKNVLTNLNIRMQGNMFAPKKTFDGTALKKLLIPPTLNQSIKNKND
ncbi:MAG TPA: exodeoxyribonuclease 7 small subunit [Rickettsia endosymbiont of Pyrocoelia pectoralis]|nr:exodeoxyribonuclease 7 small subunit [Rickettsia endosymbiont of Pyrocoelia pectoralis]